MNPTEYKTGAIAKALNVHENTIRDWSDRYHAYLSTRATSGKRKFTDDDFLLLATVADFRDKGLSFEAIEDALRNGQRIEKTPDVPTKDDIEARQNVEIVALPRDTYLLEVKEYQVQLEAYKGEIERLKADLAGAVEDKERIQSELTEAQKNYAAAIARLEVIEKERQPATYWLRVITVIVGIAVLLTILAAFFLFSLSRG